MTPSRADRISGGLLGLLVGDALGVPYEFHPPQDIPPPAQIELAPPPGFRRSHPAVPPATWSDDGAQALCLLASLQHVGHLDPGDFSRRLINWLENGYLAVDGVVFDVGNQTAQAIARLRAGAPPLEAGGADEFSQGNGSLMRVLPLALWSQDEDEHLVLDAHRQSRVTHGHPVAQACCALYGLWARRMLEGEADAWSTAVAALRAIYRDQPFYRDALEGEIRPDVARLAGGSGYVVDSLFSAREVLRAGSYEAVVRAAIALGHDTDTTACIAGGLAGVRDGARAIPIRWRQALRGQELLAPLHEALLGQAGVGGD